MLLLEIQVKALLPSRNKIPTDFERTAFLVGHV